MSGGRSGRPRAPSHFQPAILTTLFLAAATYGGQVGLSAIQFEEVTPVSGIDFNHRPGTSPEKYLIETMGSGGGFFDFNNDQLVDIYLVQSGGHHPRTRPGNRLYRNEGDQTFSLVEDPVVSDPGYGMGTAFGDFDNDGWTDIYITNFGPNVLLRNLGGGRFEDLTKKAGVGDARWSTSAAFADVNNDGLLDLYVANYLDFSYQNHVQCGDINLPSYCHPDVYQAVPNSFYLNQGNLTFKEASAAAGLVPDNPAAGKSLGVLFFDMDNDGDLDLYVANDSTANYLFENVENGKFRDVSVVSGAAYNRDGQTEAGMGVDGGDFDGNGFEDLIVTHLDFETNTLYSNSGQRFFFDQTTAARLAGPSWLRVGFGVNFADFNNDALLDLFIANGHVIDTIERENPSISYAQPNQLFLNSGKSFFWEASARAGDYFAKALVSRGSAVADFDNDGDVDILVTNNGGPAELVRNNAPAGDWIQFLLEGQGCNRNAIGARVRLSAGDYELSKEVRSGNSYCSQSDFRLHFGLPEKEIEEVKISWPCGATQKVRHPEVNRSHFVQEQHHQQKSSADS